MGEAEWEEEWIRPILGSDEDEPLQALCWAGQPDTRLLLAYL